MIITLPMNILQYSFGPRETVPDHFFACCILAVKQSGFSSCHASSRQYSRPGWIAPAAALAACSCVSTPTGALAGVRHRSAPALAEPREESCRRRRRLACFGRQLRSGTRFQFLLLTQKSHRPPFRSSAVRDGRHTAVNRAKPARFWSACAAAPL